VESLPEGFRYVPGFVTEAEERDLVARFDSLPFDEIRMRGQVARRTAIQYGYDYGYNTGSVRVTGPPPAYLEPFRARIAALMGRRADELVQAIVLRYAPGAGIGWHRDRAVFGPEVGGISLLNPTVMRLRPLGVTRGGVKVTLEPRSAYVLAGPARAEWQHHVPAVKSLRYSITFRTLVGSPGRRAAAEEVSR
jgi:alkylated DNA repair dioxygenase AlkB